MYELITIDFFSNYDKIVVRSVFIMNIYDLANCFLNKESMTHKKLQKLCYYYVAWGYALYNKAMITNPEFQAWVHGPVSKTLYSKYNHYGWNIIEQAECTIELNKEQLKLFNSVWETYGDKCGDELEALTHDELPWKEARINLTDYEPSTNPISPKTMKSYYQSIYVGNQGE